MTTGIKIDDTFPDTFPDTSPDDLYTDEPDYPEYPLVAGLACPHCDSPVLVDSGLIKPKSKKYKRRVRLYLCPACLKTTYVPVKRGKRVIFGYCFLLREPVGA